MSVKIIECENCEAYCTIEHDLKTPPYEIKHCPFCGDDLELEDGFIFYEGDWEDTEEDNDLDF